MKKLILSGRDVDRLSVFMPTRNIGDSMRDLRLIWNFEKIFLWTKFYLWLLESLGTISFWNQI